MQERNRSKTYDDQIAALKEIWIAANCICPKRFIPFLPKLLELMERFGHLQLEETVRVLPFQVQGVDTDNGSEFLNYGMVAWCNARNITFTRSRAYRKNDQAHVEEKNGSVVRRLVGYDRFEGHTRASVCADRTLMLPRDVSRRN